MAKKRAHVYVTGRVQRVYFRQSTLEQAQNHGVFGWVKNLRDGRVEAVFEGEEAAVDALVDFCRKGPIGAYVADITVNTEPFCGEFDKFEIA